MSGQRRSSPLLAGGTEGGRNPVPRLDLAPKLKRPLQLWNPLDYLRLLYWIFFFPQALRWYVETFAHPEHRKATGRDLPPALRQDPVQRNLALQSLLLTVLVPLALAAGLQLLGVPVNWVIVAVSVAGGVAGGVALGVTVGVAGGVAFGVAFGVAYGVGRARLPDYVVLALPSGWAWSQEEERGIWRASHVVFLPLPRVQKQLENWLAQNWAAGVHNINQLLAYTLQFVPAVGAVNAALAHLPEGRLLAAVSKLADEPFDWDLVRFGSASLRNGMWHEAIDGLLIVPRRFRRRWQARFPTSLYVDTPARAACAGFWLLHEGEPGMAADCFAFVRSLPGGEELYLITALLAVALGAEDAAAVGRWLEASAKLAELAEPHLRPAVVRTLRRLREVAQEADVAVHAVSPLMRSSSIGRAVAALTQLLADADETCPQPERAIVRTIAGQWRDVLAAAGGQIGQQVLRQPVENPYEGYSGLPVERTFVGREGVLARLERLWAASPDAPLPPIILYGHRRMGKTSIIHHLYRHRGPETLIARSDMQDLALADHTGQLLLGFARAIHTAARGARLDAGPIPDADDYATTGTARMALNALLERLDPHMTGRRLTLAVDEYEIAEGKIEDGKFDPDFLRYLRGAAQKYRWLGLLFAGRQTLEDELRHYRAVFFGSAEPVRVSFLTREAALHLIRQPSDDFALEYETALAEELYRLTNGQPYLLQRLCWELVNRWNDRFLKEGREKETPRTLTLADLETLLTPEFYHDFFLQADYYFSGVWHEAGPDEHQLLAALAAHEEGEGDDQPLPRAELVREAGLASDEADAAIEAALRHDLIVEKDGSFRLAVPLMRRWIRLQQAA